ncbi:hypothetical protein PYJP_16490 [Pyrofollis japonicus]|uniref:signal peptidase I n=1 Tax=Pyrofollis japonicus TaxID=3060460 RepID=UPI00295B7EC4|nr:signal peptidase I [Pyrofollis japonicus]BEP18297.1 hypothetical protein PYJP_16490 [Pyrofollis japonicus]
MFSDKMATLLAILYVVIVVILFMRTNIAVTRTTSLLIGVLLYLSMLGSTYWKRTSGFKDEAEIALISSLVSLIGIYSALSLIYGFAINALSPTLFDSLVNLVYRLPQLLATSSLISMLALGKNSVPTRRFQPVLVLGAFFALLLDSLDYASLTLLVRGAMSPIVFTSKIILATGVIASTYLLARYGTILYGTVFVLSVMLPYYVSPLLPNVPTIFLIFMGLVPSLVASMTLLNRIEIPRHEAKGLTVDAKSVVAATFVALSLLIVLSKGYWPLIILSGSMKPSIDVGDIVVVKPVSRINIGSIVAYKASNRIVVHRVINISIDKLITKGDANNAPDPPISRSQVLGVVNVKIPLIGKPLIVLARLLGGNIFSAQLFLVLMIIVAIMASPLVRMRKKLT